MASLSVPSFRISTLNVIEYNICISEGNDKKFSQICEYSVLQKFAEALERSDVTPVSFPIHCNSDDPETIRVSLDDWFFTFSTENWKTLRVYKRILARATKKGKTKPKAIQGQPNKRSFLKSVFSDQSLPTMDDLRNSYPAPNSPPRILSDEENELDHFGAILEKGFVPEEKEKKKSNSDTESGSFEGKLESLLLDELSDMTADNFDYEEILPSPRGDKNVNSNIESQLLISFLAIIQSSMSSKTITSECLQCLLNYTKASHIYLLRVNINGLLVLDGSLSNGNVWSILDSVKLSKDDIINKFEGVNSTRIKLQPVYLSGPGISDDSGKKNASVLCIPIHLQSKYFGCIYITHHTKERAFDHVHTHLIITLATNLMSLLHSLSLKRNIVRKKGENSKLPCLRKMNDIKIQDTMKIYDTLSKKWEDCFLVLNDERIYIFSSPFDSNPIKIISISQIKKIHTTSVKGRESLKIIGEKPICTKKMEQFNLIYIYTKTQHITWFSCHLFETGHNWYVNIDSVLKIIKKKKIKRKIPNNICIQQDDVIQSSIIGKGTAATVFGGTFNQSPVAIKQLLDQFDYSDEKAFFDEMEILQHLHHPNIINLFGGFINDAGRPCIVFELAQKGNLTQVLYNTDYHITIDIKYRFLIQIVQALVYLHTFNPPIIHRDLKPANILVCEDFTIKLADFGLAKQYSDNISPGQGTIKWTAPEILSNAPYTVKADIYSLGLVMWEILHQSCFFEEFKFNSLIEIQVVNYNYRPIISDSISTIMRKLIERCWNQDPTERPTAAIVANILSKIIPGELYTDVNK